MKQITAKHLAFLQEAKDVFADVVLRETHWNAAKDLIALRYGPNRDSIMIFELGEEVGFFAQMIPPTDMKKHLEAWCREYDLELGQVRPEVADFSLEMEKQLRANEYKGGWEKCTHQHLENLLEKNFRKLFSCTSHSEFQRRCANIANFAMMLHDNDRREEEERMVF